jgi:hypothetical protein
MMTLAIPTTLPVPQTDLEMVELIIRALIMLAVGVTLAFSLLIHVTYVTKRPANDRSPLFKHIVMITASYMLFAFRCMKDILEDIGVREPLNLWTLSTAVGAFLGIMALNAIMQYRRRLEIPITTESPKATEATESTKKGPPHEG